MVRGIRVYANSASGPGPILAFPAEPHSKQHPTDRENGRAIMGEDAVKLKAVRTDKNSQTSIIDGKVLDF